MGVMSDHTFRAPGGAAAREFRRSAGTRGAGSCATGTIFSVTTSPAAAGLFAHLPVHFEPVASLAFRLKHGLKGQAIERAFHRRHPADGGKAIGQPRARS